MAGVISTGLTNQYKMDILAGCAPVLAIANVQTGNTFAAGNNLLVSLTNTFPLSVGMTIVANATGINATSGSAGPGGNNVYIARIANSTALYMSVGSNGASQNNYTFTGDAINMALIKFGPANSYNANATSCYANLVTFGDEASGTGYSNGGVVLTVAQNPDVPDSATAVTNFSPNPSWTSATLDVAGAMIFTTTIRSGRTGANNSTAILAGNNVATSSNTAYHVLGVYDFGGEQKVTSGTLTVNMPTANGTAAVIRVS